ncbi:AAA family ATPase [Sphingobacterium sp. PCS056]|uniref:AAA family ATPase n=1 Tax=Sphingobacterium sp. PCS056 TaxID=2931400 RepID=UPI002010C49C|nr:AAA family ATPase [Sphingobacterium sp. PCS056]UPZ36513.1 AAA family ATPase [Sphingobacterium sp. PCS056]
MGSLIIKRVRYEGDHYVYESPELNSGINIIIGDNGSGKSTFTYLIEYCLGGYLKYFNVDNKTEKYIEIVSDTNNYAEIEVLLNGELYGFKRFIGGNVVYVNSGEEYNSFPIYRQQLEGTVESEIFSDWMLDKLSITKQELNLGTKTWKLNINDLLRLIIYDQDTPSKKIYKEPTNLNFVTDSLLIRKTIFEVLLGISSDEYFRKFEEFKNIEILRDKEHLKIEAFNERYSGIDLDIEKIEKDLTSQNIELETLYNQRDLFLSSNKKVDKKTHLISEIQEQIIQDEIELSTISLNIQANQIEFEKISKYFQAQTSEINEIEKIIFTNEKLNLFSFRLCPFCMNEHDPKENHCLCGAEIKDEDYEKFIYSSKEYENILKHKKKSLETIQTALDSYSSDINKGILKRDYIQSKIKDATEKLKALINSTDVNKNNEAIDHLHAEILELMKRIESYSYRRKIAIEKQKLEENFKKVTETYKTIKTELDDLQKIFDKNNREIISNFNSIYHDLITKSSADANAAEINEDYMPIIDQGIYKNKSAGVPVRLIYYYTILALAIKYKTVKHPRLLIIDTPEDSGIDDDNLKNDLLLLQKVLSNVNADSESYQVILTTGLEKYPSEFGPYIIERFNKKDEGKFILNEK